uniref:Uncharacterized protein n=1 Tax=Chara braunii TaxID=69332 RepID=A0A388LCR4_CHABU
MPCRDLDTALVTVELCLRGPGDDLYTDLRVTGTVYLSELGWHMLGTELALGLGKEMATEEGIDDQQSGGNQGTNENGERNEGSTRDRESTKLEGTQEDRKDASIGENSGKVGGRKRGPQKNREGGNDMRTSPWNSAGATPEKTKVLDTSHKLAEIEKRTAEFKARLIEQMIAEDEEDLQDAGSREGRRAGQDEARYEGKDDSHKGTPSKKGKNKSDPPAEGTENAMTPPAIDIGTSRLPATPKVTAACDGLWSLRERVLGWFDPEGTSKTREKQRESKEGEGASAAGEAGGSEDGLKKVVATLNRTLNKNQGYLADAKKKLTFDGANIMEFLIDYEKLAALLKWTEEEKMKHLGQYVSLSLGRDIMVIVASSGSWKETRNEMMRKYLRAEKMATEVELAEVQRKNYATYNDFLRAFTLVALRIPGVTDRIMSKYFLKQFSEFDKDKILSAYQQTSKFEYARDVDFSTVTDLAEKTVVTETLALLKEGEVIDLTGKTGDKAYLFGRRFIIRIDPTNVVGALKNYKPIDPTVGRWIGFIWQFDYKVERIAGLRNRADGLSRVCITPEKVEDAEPTDAFLEYEGGTLVVDNEMANLTITTEQLLIQTLEKGARAVVAELREGPVTMVRRKEENDSWGAEVGAREELMAMTVEGGWDAVMTLAETWAQKECQYLVNLTREEQGADQNEQEFFLIQMYEGVFKEIGLLLVGNKQPTEVSPKAREEVEKYVLRNDHLFKREEGMMPRRVVCGRSRQLDIIQAMHDGLVGGHQS